MRTTPAIPTRVERHGEKQEQENAAGGGVLPVALVTNRASQEDERFESGAEPRSRLPTLQAGPPRGGSGITIGPAPNAG